MSVPSKLTQLRNAKGLTQSQLSQLANVTQPRISDFEHGTRDIRKASVDVVKRIAAALNCTVNDLI